MTLPSPRLHPDPAPRMVTHWCRRAEGDPSAPCTCGMCDRSATDPAPDTSGDWSLYGWAAVTIAVAMVTHLPRELLAYFRRTFWGLHAIASGPSGESEDLDTPTAARDALREYAARTEARIAALEESVRRLEGGG